MRKISNNIFSNDIFLTVSYFSLLIIGFVSIFSSQHSNDIAFFSLENEAFKQSIWIVLCLLIFFFVSILEYRFIFDLALPLYIISIFLLVFVLFFGQEVNNHTSWFNFFGFKFQPSEFSKLSTALLLAKVFDSYSIKLNKARDFLMVSSIIILPSIIILFQGDAGTALVYSSFFLVFFREGLSINFLLLILLFVVVFISGLILDSYILYIFITIIFLVSIGLSLKNYKKILNSSIFFVFTLLLVNGQDFFINNVLSERQKMRIETLLNPNSDPLGAGWNITQSKIAIGSGGLSGKGFLQGTQTGLNFVPIQTTDFIFSVIGEEFGFVGSILFIILYLLFLYRILYLSENQKDKFGRVFGYSTFCVLIFHFTINISMTLGIFPVIGIPLGFISYGGSSLMSFSLLIFIFLRLNSVKPSLLAR